MCASTAALALGSTIKRRLPACLLAAAASSNKDEWLRGTAAVTSVVGKNYSADRAELLYQPDLVKHFHNQLTKMPADMKKHLTIKAISKGLQEIQGLMEKSSEGFKMESVARIGVICNDLLKMITPKSK